MLNGKVTATGFSQFVLANDAIATAGVSLLDFYNAITSIEGKPVQCRGKDAITALESNLFDSYNAIASIRVTLFSSYRIRDCWG